MHFFVRKKNNEFVRNHIDFLGHCGYYWYMLNG